MKESLEKTGWAMTGHNGAGKGPLLSLEGQYKRHGPWADHLAPSLPVPLLPVIRNHLQSAARTTAFRLVSSLA